MPLITSGSRLSSSDQIVDGIILNADVNANAAIAGSKLDLAGDIVASDLAAAALVTESEGINSSDNDTSVPTTAAVKDYVDTNAAAIKKTISTTKPFSVGQAVYVVSGDFALSDASAAGTAKFLGFTENETGPVLADTQAWANRDTTPWSYTLPAGNDRLIIVALTYNSAPNHDSADFIASMTFDGVALTNAKQVVDAGGAPLGEVWYGYKGTSASPTTANIAITAGAGGLAAWIAEVITFENVNQTTGVNQSNSSTGADLTQFSITPNLSGSYLLAYALGKNVTGAQTLVFGTGDFTEDSSGEAIAGGDDGNILRGHVLSYNTNAKTFAPNDSGNGTVGGISLEILGVASNQVAQVNKQFTTTGLTSGSDYFITDTPGAIGTTAGTVTLKVGKALSTTSLLIVQN